MHHPFTRPKTEDMPLFEAKKFPEVRAEAYDVVLNGVEIGGGSMRIYEPELQEKMFEALGISPEDRQSQFGHLLRALRLGAPPHGGIAFGLRPPGHADLRRAKHSRRDGVSEKQSRHGFDDQFARRSGSASASRLVPQAGERQKSVGVRLRSDSITQGLFPIQRAGQSILFHGNRLRARVLYLVRLSRVELDVFREFRREVGLGIDGVHRAYLYACHAIDAVLRVNDHLVVHFVEAGDRADLYTVGELASVTFVGHDVGHGISVVESCVKKTAVM